MDSGSLENLLALKMSQFVRILRYIRTFDPSLQTLGLYIYTF